MFRVGCTFLFPTDSLNILTRAQNCTHTAQESIFMSKFLYRLGSWSYRKVWTFLAFWLIVLVAMAGLTAGFA